MLNDLFEYLKNILYNPKTAKLDILELPEEHKKLGLGLKYLHECIIEQHIFVKGLSKGNLDAPLPASDNPITGDLRALHGSMSHLVWQANQIANGDYSQRVDFMGELSDVFNIMVEQLEAREKQLVNEISIVQQKNQLLKQGQDLLTTLTDNMLDWVCVLSDDGTFHYLNKSCKVALGYSGAESKDIFTSKLFDARLNNSAEIVIYWDLPISSETIPLWHQYFSLNMHSITWDDSPSTLYILKNITNERESHELAFQDSLTMLNNRRYGMRYIDNCIDKGGSFNIAFIDIDFLKYVNDTFGHAVGDEYIVETANQLLSLSKPREVFRIGGDEFLVVSYSLEAFSTELENIRNSFINSSHNYRRSFSYGIVSTEEGYDSISALLEAADSRMYLYKCKHKKIDIHKVTKKPLHSSNYIP